MSKESKPKKTRSTKKVSEGESLHTAELEAKIAELEAKLTNLSSQVKPAEAKHTHKAPPPPPAPKPSSSRGTLPAGFNAPPPPQSHTAPPPAPKPEPAKPRPTASGPTHGTLPADFKAPPPPAPKEEPRATSSTESTYSGEVSPTYAKLSSTGYSGNKYFATRPRLSYHPANKQFKGEATTSTTRTTAPPPPEPAKPKTQRGTLPAGFKP